MEIELICWYYNWLFSEFQKKKSETNLRQEKGYALFSPGKIFPSELKDLHSLNVLILCKNIFSSYCNLLYVWKDICKMQHRYFMLLLNFNLSYFYFACQGFKNAPPAPHTHIFKKDATCLYWVIIQWNGMQCNHFKNIPDCCLY